MNFLPTFLPAQDTCETIRTSFSSYLDGAVNGHEMQRIAAHLESCGDCNGEFAAWQTMQQTLSAMRTARAPEDLGLRLRLAISREQAARHSKWRDTLSLAWANTLRPIALQASAGFACALTLVGTIVLLLGVVTPPNAVLANDEPLRAVTAPRYLYSAVSPQPIVIQNSEMPNGGAIVIEASINSAGRVYDYHVVCAPNGPDASAIQSQIADQLLLAVFRPASAFGIPVKGHVVMTLAGVSVHA